MNSRGKFVRAEQSYKQAKFQTPKNPKDEVQKTSDVIGTETKVKIDLRKRQLNKKYKHRGYFKNPDGSDIVTPDEFRDSQVRYLKESKNNKYISDAILLGKGSNPKDVEGIFDDITQHVVII